MRILSVVWFKVLPPKYGGQKGTALFNQYLADYAELTCLCSKNNTPSQALPYTIIPELPVSKLQFLNPACWLQVLKAVKNSKAHIILLEYPYHGLAAVLAKKVHKTMLVLHEHNIEFLRFKALGKWWWRALYIYERWVNRQADLALFKTKEDLDEAVTHFKLNPSKCIVVPYGTGKYKPLSAKTSTVRQQFGIKPNELVILFAGTLDYEPNAKAVVSIYRHLIPALECKDQLFKILICGRLKKKAFHYLRTLQHPNVLFIGEVDDIAPYYAAADVFIDPVVHSGGIQTKILDALSHHCPVVAFEGALAGFDTSLSLGKVLSVRNGDWEGFATGMRKVAQDKSETPIAFFHTYGWPGIIYNIVPEFNALIE